MNIKKTIITAAVAVTMVAMIAPMTAGAATSADLQAQINALMAQLQGLQGTTGVPAACVGVTFSRNLTVGSTGQDVKCLQVILNMSASTQVSASGAGSPGNETTYFGARTLVAVRIWQASKGWAPANQIGPMSRAALNAWLTSGTGTTTTPPPAGLPAGCTSTAGYSPVTGQSCSTGATTQTGPVSAMLASDNPVAGVIVGGQATADLLHIAFNGNGTVTSVKLNRTGVSDQNTLTNVYLFDGATRITDGYSFNLQGQIVMNGLNIAVNGSHVISVRGDAKAFDSTASSIQVTLTSYTANGSTSSSNIMGNMMMVVPGSLATSSLSANTVASATVNAGTASYTFWSAPIQVNTRAIWLKGANFRMIGSAPSDALSNLKMFIDGVDTGKVGAIMTIQGSNYAVFDLMGSPISLMTGSHTIDLRGDVQKGSNRTITVSVQQAADLTLFDSQVGVNIAATGTIPNNAGTISINTGSATVTIDPVFNAMTNITGGSANAVIGKFKVHAYGEDVKVNSLVITPLIASATAGGCTTNSSGVATAGTCGLNNVTLYFNGSQVGTQQNLPSAGGNLTYQLGSQLIAPAGQDSWLEVHADLQTINSVNYTAGNASVVLVTGSSNAQGQNSLATLNFPTATVTGNVLAVQTGLLVVSKSTAYLNQTVTPNTPGVKIGSYVLQNQSTSESVRVTSMVINLTSDGTTALTELTTPKLSNFSALRTSETSGSGSTPVQPAASNTFSVNKILAPGASTIIDIYADTSTGSSGNLITTLVVTSIGVTSNISTTSSATTGQTIGLGTGTIAAPTLVTSSTTPAQFIAAGGGASNATQATFSFVSTSGASNITELKFTVTGSDSATSQTVTSVCVGSVCASPVSGTAYLTGLNLSVPNGGSGLTQPVLVSYSPVGTNGIPSANTSVVSLTFAKYTSGGTTSTIGTSVVCTATIGGACTTTLAVGGVAAPSMTLVGSKPTVVTTGTSNAGLLLGAENKIGEVTVTADAKGNIKINDIKFNVGTSNITTPVFTSARIADGNTTITGSGCGQSATIIFCEFGTSGNTFTTTTGTTDVETDTDYDGYQIAAGTSKTFSLFATLNGTITTAGSQMLVSTQVDSTGFNWDDTASAVFVADASAASPSAGTNLTGASIYNFPTNSYSIHN